MLKPPAVIFSSSVSNHQSFPTKYILKEETLNNLHYLRLPDKVGSYTDVTDFLSGGFWAGPAQSKVVKMKKKILPTGLQVHLEDMFWV